MGIYILEPIRRSETREMKTTSKIKTTSKMKMTSKMKDDLKNEENFKNWSSPPKIWIVVLSVHHPANQVIREDAYEFKLTAFSVSGASYQIQPQPSSAWSSVWPGSSQAVGESWGCLNKSKLHESAQLEPYLIISLLTWFFHINPTGPSQVLWWV